MSNAFEYLHSLDVAYREQGKSLPQVEVQVQLWSGIGFSIDKNELLVDMEYVVEILEHIESTNLPVAQPWFKGLANVRGNLVPVVDLGHYLFGNPTKLDAKSRYIVVDTDSLNIALLVSGVLGMRSFKVSSSREFSKATRDELKPFILNAFETPDEYWNVFDVHSLVESEKFNQISLQ